VLEDIVRVKQNKNAIILTYFTQRSVPDVLVSKAERGIISFAAEHHHAEPLLLLNPSLRRKATKRLGRRNKTKFCTDQNSKAERRGPG